mgnify:CR=1 FL=1
MTASIRPRRSALYMPGSNARALEKARTLEADVVIMDLSMPGIGGIEGIQRIISRDSSARILALTMLGDELVTRVMQIGAKGYLSKTSASHMLVKAVRTIMRGKTFINVDDGVQSLLNRSEERRVWEGS